MIREIVLIIAFIITAKFGFRDGGLVTVYNPDGLLATTCTTLQEGIDACPEGGTVISADGTYTAIREKWLT
jgi:hypothetical protein